jgi:hypothetical protein
MAGSGKVTENSGSFIACAALGFPAASKSIVAQSFPKSRLMRTKISNRAIATIRVIGWAAIVTVMGMFLTVIGAGITECLANPR